MDLGIRFLLVECGVDWITATAGTGGRSTALMNRAHEWVEERGSEGYQIKHWAWNGYVGATVDGCSFGKRPDGTIIRLSSSMARRHWKSAMVFADNVSRFDVQTTVLDREGESNIALNAYRKAGENAQIHSGICRSQYIESTPTGSTLSIGSRASDRYLRLYDKTAESDGEYPNRCWRYEVEYKQRRAYKVASDTLASRHEASAVHNRVRACFNNYGLNVAGEGPSLGWRDAGIVRATDDQRRLEWVRRCIRPVVGRLVEAYDSQTIAAALGFTLYPAETLPGAVAWWAFVPSVEDGSE